MKERLLNYLSCPDCGGEFALEPSRREEREIIEGALRCRHCRVAYPVRGGVPRFVDPEADAQQRATAENFGAQWQAFDEVRDYHEEQFRDWIAPVTPEFVRGRVVLEGGCGKGRHTRSIANWGARDVIGVDLSRAVNVAFANTRDLPNAHIIQADLYRLPLRPLFDYAFSVGVLHHLPDPRRGFAALAGRLRSGGAISAWVYGRENNGWIIRLVNPLREHLTSRLPARALYHLSYLPSAALFLALRTIYRPFGRTALGRHLFYADYLTYISRFPFREIHNIVHDHLTAPVARYIERDEFAGWFAEAQVSHCEIAWHNRNSWRGFGCVGARAEARHGR